jgi:hypothetical protein
MKEVGSSIQRIRSWDPLPPLFWAEALALRGGSMVLEVAPDRSRCRRCGTKLTKPTSNQRSAFCCRGCFRIFYSKRCLACEEPKAEPGKALCGRRNCRLEFNGLKRHGMLGWYYAHKARQESL